MARKCGENSITIRDERGRYLKGIAGGPGRPAVSRNRLTDDFLGDLHAAWQEHGREAIDRVVAEQPRNSWPSRRQGRSAKHLVRPKLVKRLIHATELLRRDAFLSGRYAFLTAD